MSSARLVLAGGTIHTMAAGGSASSVVAESGRIVEVRPPGAPEPVPLAGERRIDLAGGTLLPGFIDAHTHLIHWGLRFVRPDLGDTQSLDEALERVSLAHHRLPPGGALLAEGFDDSRWGRPRFPTRADLDAITTERPVILRRVCGHMAVANTKALSLLPADASTDPDSGLLVEDAAMGLSRHFPPSSAELDQAFAEAQKSYHAMGVTAVHDMATPEHLRAYARAAAAGGLRLSITAILTRPHLDLLAGAGLGAGWSRGRVRVWGVKFFADGSLGARTAALLDPYEDAPGETGMLLLTRDELAAAVRTGEEAGIPLAVHAIGDRAVRTVIDAFAAGGAQASTGHRIEHLEMVAAEDLDRMKRMGIIASLQPNFIGRWGQAGGLYETRLGRRRTALMNPLRRIRDRGIPLILGSDAMPAGVLPGLAAAVAAPHPGQRLTPAEALEGATRDAAAAVGDHEGGRIVPGARADFVLLDRDPLSGDGALQGAVRQTLVGGETVWPR